MKLVLVFACFIAFAFIPFSKAQNASVSGTIMDRLQKLEQENLELKKQMLEMQKQIAESLRQNQTLLQQNQEVQKQNLALLQQIQQNHQEDMKRLTSLEVRQIKAWSARNTGCAVLNSNNTGWTTIPGLVLTFELREQSMVQMIANGTQRAENGMVHVGYRFVFDGVPQGNGSWGQRINMNYSDKDWWNIWTLAGFVNMGPGQHTIEVQVIGNGCHAIICGEAGGGKSDYADGTLQVIAIPR